MSGGNCEKVCVDKGNLFEDVNMTQSNTVDGDYECNDRDGTEHKVDCQAK